MQLIIFGREEHRRSICTNSYNWPLVGTLLNMWIHMVTTLNSVYIDYFTVINTYAFA